VNAYAGYYGFQEKHFENYKEFNPMRWIKNDDFVENESDPFVFLPFWAGKRTCIGQYLAKLEIRNMLIHFISKYDFELEDNYQL
jgi:cytochrome P450